MKIEVIDKKDLQKRLKDDNYYVRRVISGQVTIDRKRAEKTIIILK